MILITHDLGVVAETAQTVMVMYAGRADGARAGAARSSRAPQHPYTWGLLGVDADGRAKARAAGRDRGLAALVVSLPPGARSIRAARTASRRDDRAARRSRRSRAATSTLPPRPAEQARDLGRERGRDGSGRPDERARRDALIEVEHLTKHFPVTQGVFSRSKGERPRRRGRHADRAHAARRSASSASRAAASRRPRASCCGCSSRPPARSASTAATSRTSPTAQMRPLRREMQMIFQDPYSSLNPRKTVGQIVGQPFASTRRACDASEARVQSCSTIVGLSPEHANRYPHEFSGGQRQRIGIARALALRPKLIVCDEPVSALDVSVQAQILNLLELLQEEFGLTYVFISHDLSVMRQICDRIAVMYLGRDRRARRLGDDLRAPRHPYTAALISAPSRVCRSSGAGASAIVLSGDVPSPVDPSEWLRLPPALPAFAPGDCDVVERSSHRPATRATSPRATTRSRRCSGQRRAPVLRRQRGSIVSE